MKIQDKLHHLDQYDAQLRIVNEKIMRMDEQMNHYGEAIEEVARQVESANRFAAASPHMNLSGQRRSQSGIGSPLDTPREPTSKIATSKEAAALR